MKLSVFNNASIVSLSNQTTVNCYAITPDMAKDILENHNTKNPRILRDAYWKAYCEDMLKGNWTAAQSDMIVIDVEGNLINGQNRLKAVLESGTTQIFWVMENAPVDLALNMDNGKARNLNDYVRMAGFPKANTIAPIGRILTALKTGTATLSNILYGRTSRNVSTTRNTVLDIMQEEKESLIRYLDFATAVASQRLDGSHASNIGIAFMLIDQLNQSNQLEAFATHMKAITTTHTECILAIESIMKAKTEINDRERRAYIVYTILAAYDIFTSNADLSIDAIRNRLKNIADIEKKYNDIITNYRALR